MKSNKNNNTMPYKQGVTGSTPVIPTTENQALTKIFVSAFFMHLHTIAPQLLHNYLSSSFSIRFLNPLFTNVNEDFIN